MPIVQETVTDAAGNALGEAQIDILLIGSADADGNAPGYGTSPNTILGRWRTWTDAEGQWSASLLANALLEPDNTWYLLTRKARGVESSEALLVPDGTATYWVHEVLTVPPTALPTFLSDSLALALAEAALAGTGSKVSREDHVHPTTGLELQAQVTTSANYTALSTDRVILANVATSRTITLPTTGIAAGKQYVVRKIDQSQNTVTIAPASGTIDNKTSTVLRNVGESITAVFDGTNYWTVAQNRSQVFRIKDFGARGDGVTDDTAALVAALVAMRDTTIQAGGVLYFDRGIYLISGATAIARYSNAIWRGEGMFASIIRNATSTANMLQSGTWSGGFGTAVFEDLGFDCVNTTTTAFVHSGDQLGPVTWRRCRFYHSSGTTSPVNYLDLNGANGNVIEDCVFETLGLGDTTAISLRSGCRNVTIRRNRFEWLFSGVQIDTGNATLPDEELSEFITIEDNDFDMHWWALPVLSGYTNSGGAVTFTNTGAKLTLNDSAAAFSGLGITSGTWSNVRLLVPRRAGTITATDNAEMSDAGAAFSSGGYGIISGEFLRSGTKWAYIGGIQSDTVLRHEGWRDLTTGVRVPPPSAGAAYTVYQVVIGRTTAFTATSITTDRWHDLMGNTIVPADGTLYEVPRNHPNYPIHCESAARHITAARNTVRHPWSDGISIYCDRADIVDNFIEDGQDTGITLNMSVSSAGALLGQVTPAGRSRVMRNRIRRMGAEGIWCTANDTLIDGNVIEGPMPFQNQAITAYLAGIVIYDAQRVTVQNNQIFQDSGPLAQYGISFAHAAADCIARNNRITGVTVADYRIQDTAQRIHITQDFPGPPSISVAGSGKVGILNVVGSGSPEGAVRSTPGGQYRNTDGGVNTTLWAKESGDGTNTGWAAK